MAIAAILGFIASIAGIIIIYVSAFRAHVIWGVLSILLAPIVLPIFAVRHWVLARGGLLLLIIGLITVSYAAYSEAQWPPHRYLLSLTKPEKLGTLGRVLWGKKRDEPDSPVADAPPIDPLANNVPVPKPADAQLKHEEKSVPVTITEEPVTKTPDSPAQASGEDVVTSKASPPPDVLEKIAAQKEAEQPVKYTEVDLEDLPAYFGLQVRMTDLDGKVHEGILKDQEGPELIVEKSFAAGGIVEFRLALRNIVKLEALNK